MRLFRQRVVLTFWRRWQHNDQTYDLAGIEFISSRSYKRKGGFKIVTLVISSRVLEDRQNRKVSYGN